ncbi:MAG: IPT/TIG domain-containing protein [Bryobacteraceae bacterium]|nr:IPT/TIG domain-containing protein [Bryobacteraceae bacterium]
MRTRLAMAFLMLPFSLAANSAGAPGAATGAPPSEGNCTRCHAGTVNSGGGSLAIEASTYQPGQRQTIRVRLTQENRSRFGFALTARLRSNRQAAAGTFTAGSDTRISNDVIGGAQVPYVTHSPARNAQGTTTWEVEWTAPNDPGGVVFYAAGNAANGNFNNGGDSIYTTTLEIAAAAGGNRPSINSGGVVTATAFGGAGRGASGSWLEIYGSNLSPEERRWDSGFQGDNAPTALGDVSVLINNQPAPISFATPGQINVQVPDSPATGNVQVVVRRGTEQSDAFTLMKLAEAPAVLAPAVAPFRDNDRQFLVALYPPNTPGCPATGDCFAGNFAGVASRLPRPGDTLIVYGVGFGPVQNEAGQRLPIAGQIIRQLNRTVQPVRFRFGQTEAQLTYSGLAPNFIGLYQFNVVVPQVAAGVTEIEVSLGSTNIGQRLFLQIGQ